MVDLFFIIKWYIRCYILNLIFGKTHGRRFCAVLIFSQCKRKPSFLHFAVEIGIFDEYLKYPLSFRGGPKRTLLMLSAIFKYCYFCVPSLSMLFSTHFSNYTNSDKQFLCFEYPLSFSGINISNNEAGGLHSAFPTWYKISPIRVSDLMRYIFRPRHRYCLDYTYNSISRSHQSLKFVSACLAVDPTSRSEIQISFTGLK